LRGRAEKLASGYALVILQECFKHCRQGGGGSLAGESLIEIEEGEADSG
jgi:hypothetical protein